MSPDDWAKERGWLVLVSGEAYERSLSSHRALYVYVLDDGRWQSVYFSRSPQYGDKVKELAVSRSWRAAFEKAHGFEKWLQGGSKKGGQSRNSAAAS